MISTIHTFDTIYSADSVEWCPYENYKEFFVCGTYQLEDTSKAAEDSQFNASCKRKGRIYLFQFNLENESLTEVFQIETNAILDMKWHPSENIIATADSKGFVILYKLENDQLRLLCELKLENESDVLALSLDWNRISQQNELIVSDSKGGFSLLQYSESQLKLMYHHPTSHSFEAWISIFDRHNPNIVYTGGDDTFLNCFDTRIDPERSTLKWKNKSHGAGVTSVLSPSHKENSLITGSYDEKLRFFDIRNPKCEVFDLALGGGIWRIKQHPSSANDLLTANMYHNFTVLKLNSNKFDLEASYFEHKSICYGADWCPSANIEVKYLATCSFYDHKLCVSKYETNKEID
uniref:methylated diphthine methylhydrolase n=1 Tax=Culicoides sonorensis TaxID=179676 RepID=A0A336K1G3_CULSO